MLIPTEPIGSIPGPEKLIEAIKAFEAGNIQKEKLDEFYSLAIHDTMKRFEQIRSPVITVG